MKNRPCVTRAWRLLAWLLCLAPCFPALAYEGEREIRKGSSHHTFVDPAIPDRPIEVYTYRPSKLEPTSPVLFVMHGTLRNADAYRDAWITHAVKYNALLLVPEFSKEHFKYSAMYHCGNVTHSRRGVNPKATWSFTAIEGIFDDAKKLAGNQSERYYLYGHSAGSQFVHRMILQMPEARIERAVAANAGAYSMPDFGVAYPYGLGESAATPESLKASLAVELHVLLGKLDKDEKGAHLPSSPQALAQGPHRLARGQGFFQTAKELAGDLETEFAWKLQLVPGVGHSNSGMSRSAAKALFETK